MNFGGQLSYFIVLTWCHRRARKDSWPLAKLARQKALIHLHVRAHADVSCTNLVQCVSACYMLRLHLSTRSHVHFVIDSMSQLWKDGWDSWQKCWKIIKNNLQPETCCCPRFSNQLQNWESEEMEDSAMVLSWGEQMDKLLLTCDMDEHLARFDMQTMQQVDNAMSLTSGLMPHLDSFRRELQIIIFYRNSRSWWDTNY